MGLAMRRAFVPVLLFCLWLTACDRSRSPEELAAARREAVAAAEPAVIAALADPVMSDPDLSVADDSRRVRHVEGPATVTYPPRSKANAPIFAVLDGFATPPLCETAPGEAWRAGIPPAFALYPRATGIEIAGTDAGRCRVRVANFAAAATPWTILAHYRGRATQAGYATDLKHRGADHVLNGRRAKDGASFYMIVSPRAKASAVSVLTSGG